MKTNSLKLLARTRRPSPLQHAVRCPLALLVATIVAAGNLSAFAQEGAAPLPDTTQASTNAEERIAMPVSNAGGAVAAPANGTDAPKVAEAGGTGLNLNFRNAPIDLVLEHLSKAAGFIIQMDSSVHGSVSVIGQN